MSHHNVQTKVLRTICPDAKGLIANITNICFKHELNIVQNNEYVDHRTGRFFMRTELEGIFNDNALLADLDSALPKARYVNCKAPIAAVLLSWSLKRRTAWATC